MVEIEIDCEYTGEIVCPYCGFEYEDSWEFRDNSGEEICAECGKKFNWLRNIETTYSTSKISDSSHTLKSGVS